MYPANTQTAGSVSRKKLFFVIGGVTLLVVAAIIYVFIFQTSDNAKAKDVVASLRSSYTTIADIAGPDTAPSAFSNDAINKVQTAATDYQKAMDTLSTEPAMTRDGRAKVAFDEYRQTLTNYGKATLNFAASLKFYQLTGEACGALTGKIDSLTTQTAFDEAAVSCRTLLKAGESSPDATFNTNVFDAYRANMDKLLNTMRQAIGAPTASNRAEVLKASVALGTLANQKADYTLSPSPVEALDKLASAL